MQQKTLKRTAFSLLAMAGGALSVLGFNYVTRGGLTSEHANLENPHQIETIFVNLDVDTLSVPVERKGSGGGLTTIGESLLLLTHEGRFFDVSGEVAKELDIAPPSNGWDAMIAFEAKNPSYNFANFFFRFNDVGIYENRLIVSFTQWVENDSCYRTALASTPINNVSSIQQLHIEQQDWQILFATDPCLPPNPLSRAISGHMAGGRFQIDGETIYLASGDYAIDGIYASDILAQNPAMQYGKVLAINAITGESRTVSQGHSNMQGISFDKDGKLWAVEHGRRGGDEINLIREGFDYGWPQVSLGTRYNRLPLNTLSYGRHPVFEPPIYSWLPSVAISSLTLVDEFHPAWDGDLLAGSLMGQSLFRIRIEEGRVLFAERIPLGQRIRYVQMYQDQIAIWTDQRTVMRLTVGGLDASYQFAVAKAGQIGLSPALEAETISALGHCSECHSFGVLAGQGAPPLGAVFGRGVASFNGYEYSDPLIGVGGSWTQEKLRAFLGDTENFAPGTSMPNPEITNSEVLESLVQILVALSKQAE